uniref:Uncharacterized protein n=1 Tax=Candidozyma auris TaxID=498019 RepID=A0A0L0NYB3_CANAR
MIEVVVVKSPSELVVTIMTPESVSTAPSDLVEVQVEVKVVNGGGMIEVVVVNSPFESVVTTTTPESVSVSPSELLEVQVEV